MRLPVTSCMSPVLSAITGLSSGSSMANPNANNLNGLASPVSALLNGASKLHRAQAPDRDSPSYQGQNSNVPMESLGIKEVFEYNLEEEMKKINKLIKKYPFIAIDTEFPGVVARPCGTFNTNIEYEYALFKVNVDLMKIIQLGLSFFDESGNQPTPVHTWQFNFRFNLAEEMYAQDSIKLLIHSGIQFTAHETDGIDPEHFAERLIVSNIVCNDRIRFLTFHSAYDFGYLLKVLEGNENLPKTEKLFLEKLKSYFPHIYDIKHMIRDNRSLKGGLQDLANQFGLQRVGAQHQAGSDSCLTGQLFFRLRDEVFKGKLEEFTGKLFGLTGNFSDRMHVPDNVRIKENVNKNGHTAASPITNGITSLSLAENVIDSENDEKGEGRSAISTFTVLSNVNLPDKFTENAGYFRVANSHTGEFVMSNDPAILAQQNQHSHHYSHNSMDYNSWQSNGGYS